MTIQSVRCLKKPIVRKIRKQCTGLADSFTSDRNDQSIETLIDRLYDYSRVHPSPEQWLRLIPMQYEIGDDASIDELDFIDPLKTAIRHTLEEAVALTSDMKRIALMPDGPEPLAATAEADLMWIDEAIRRIARKAVGKKHMHFLDRLNG